MILKDISFENPLDNLVYDDVLLHLADKVNEQEYLRFWESSVYFVVLGRIGKEQEDINVSAVKTDNISVLRRSSGGGTVLQGRGCLNFACVLDKRKDKGLDDLKRSYAIILDKVIQALNLMGVAAHRLPISDIALDNNKKVSGNAQKRGRNFILHHGTILYDFDLPLIAKYLNMPQDMPAYREARNHLDFVANVQGACDTIKSNIASAFGHENIIENVTDQERTLLDEFKNKRNLVVDI